MPMSAKSLRLGRVLALVFGIAALAFMSLTVWFLFIGKTEASLASFVIGVLLLSTSVSLVVKTEAY